MTAAAKLPRETAAPSMSMEGVNFMDIFLMTCVAGDNSSASHSEFAMKKGMVTGSIKKYVRHGWQVTFWLYEA